ncbi:MFS transporter [Microbispora hainanensis]|uniref:MFS transporter n=1 Tax=Microbispora hainanensis TaxID=568844 RepID=A0A544Y885_9ACTN|nr:MFS transporter [Microbispora hainanensis]
MSEVAREAGQERRREGREGRAVRRARAAVTAVFAVNGALIASLAVRTPSLKTDHDLTTGLLGLLTALVAVAALAATQVAGRLAARIGSAWVVRIAAVTLPLALLGVGLAGGPVHLAAAMLLVGAANGLLDTGMNAQAVMVERAAHRPIMNGCHAAWSIGSVAGSFTGGVAAQAGMSLTTHYLILGAVVTAVVLVVGRGLPAEEFSAEHPPARTDDGAGRRGWRAGWTRRVLLLGALGAAVLACEGAVITWSGVFLHEDLGASLGVASLGLVAFTASQTAGRLVGDRLSARHPARVLVRSGTALAAAGLTAVVVAPTPILAVAGFALAGLGLATPLPLIFSAAGHAGTEEGGTGATAAVARLTTMTYSAMLLAPALVGRVAQALGLTWTLALLVPLLVTVAWKAQVVARPPSSVAPPVVAARVPDEAL